MPEKWEVIDSNYISSIENLNINDWTKIQMTKTLELLNWKKEDQLSFYSIEWEKVIYNINLVIKYLTHLCKKEDWTLKTWKEMMDDMQIENKKAWLSYGVSTPWIMAVQIALEYLGYDVWKIDWNSWLDTKKMIRKYQKDNNLPIDWQPRPPMISLLIDRINEKLWPKIELDEITKNFIQQWEKLYWEWIFQINQDWSLNVTEKLEFWINKWGNDTNTNDIWPIEKILKNTLKDWKCIAIEINNNGKKNNIIIVKNEWKIICHSIFPIEVLCFDHDYNSSIKIIWDIGIDKYFLINNYENIWKIQSLRDLWITMESSKEI